MVLDLEKDQNTPTRTVRDQTSQIVSEAVGSSSQILQVQIDSLSLKTQTDLKNLVDKFEQSTQELTTTITALSQRPVFQNKSNEDSQSKLKTVVVDTKRRKEGKSQPRDESKTSKKLDEIKQKKTSKIKV